MCYYDYWVKHHSPMQIYVLKTIVRRMEFSKIIGKEHFLKFIMLLLLMFITGHFLWRTFLVLGVWRYPPTKIFKKTLLGPMKSFTVKGSTMVKLLARYIETIRLICLFICMCLFQRFSLITELLIWFLKLLICAGQVFNYIVGEYIHPP